jgi:DNA-binding transcriptional LysR family regulator
VGACAAGLGFALLLSYQVEFAVRAGKLYTVLPGFEPPPLPASLVYPESRLLSPHLPAFLYWTKPHSREGTVLLP